VPGWLGGTSFWYDGRGNTLHATKGDAMPRKSQTPKTGTNKNAAPKTRLKPSTPTNGLGMEGRKGGAAGMSVSGNGWETQYNALAKRVTDQEKRLNQFSQTMARIGGWFTKLGGPGTGNAGT
jgi:hypothetical protein